MGIIDEMLLSGFGLPNRVVRIAVGIAMSVAAIAFVIFGAIFGSSAIASRDWLAVTASVVVFALAIVCG